MRRRLARAFNEATGWTPAGAAVGSLALIGALTVFLGVMSAILRLFGVG